MMIKTFLFLLLSVELFAVPSWFLKLHEKNQNVYIGYGVAKSGIQAKQDALSDIASQIFVSVNDSVSSHVSDVNGHVSSSNESETSQKSFATLSDYKLLKSEYDAGEYYVALSYENIPSLDKFLRKVKALQPRATLMQRSEEYLSFTPISHEIERKLGYQLAFNLVRKDKKWYIQDKQVMQILDKKDFRKFFVSKENAHLSLHTNRRGDILHEGDKFYFDVKTKEDGYVTLLDVYEDGTVATLLKNIGMKKGVLQKLPDEDFESVPEASLLLKGEETYDLYVAIFSKKRLKLDSFAYADDALISEEKYKNFDTLIRFLDDKIYTTLKVVTKPR